MNKSFIKLLTDFGPLIIFFTVYYKGGKNLETAIPPLIIATIFAVIIIYYLDKKIPYVPLIGAILITIFGGLTIFFKNHIFIYLKPTKINILLPVNKPAPKATMGGLDKRILSINAGKNLFHGVFVRPMP